jgi:hypothetical protein
MLSISDLTRAQSGARSIKSNTVSRNTADAELKDLGLTTVQTVWLRGFLKKLGFEQLKPTIIHVDNIAAKYLAEPFDEISNNVDHLVVELNYIKKQVLNGFIEISILILMIKSFAVDIRKSRPNASTVKIEHIIYVNQSKTCTSHVHGVEVIVYYSYLFNYRACIKSTQSF